MKYSPVFYKIMNNKINQTVLQRYLLDKTYISNTLSSSNKIKIQSVKKALELFHLGAKSIPGIPSFFEEK